MDCPTENCDPGSKKGLMNLDLAGKIVTIFLLACTPVLQAAENADKSQTELPDLEFLEFLGQFETDEGTWIDPGSLIAEEFEQLLNATRITSPDAAAADDDDGDNDIPIDTNQ